MQPWTREMRRPFVGRRGPQRLEHFDQPSIHAAAYAGMPSTWMAFGALARSRRTNKPACEAVAKVRSGVQEPPCTSFPRKRESGIGSKANRIRSPGFQGVSAIAAVAEIRNPTTVDPVPDPHVRGDDGTFTTASCAGLTLWVAEPPGFARISRSAHPGSRLRLPLNDAVCDTRLPGRCRAG